MIYWGLLSGVFWVFTLIIYLVTLNAKTLRLFLSSSVGSALFLLMILVRNNGDYFIYLIPPCKVIISILFFWDVLNKEEQIDKSCDYTTIGPVVYEEIYIYLCFLIEAIFFSPSLKMTALAYTPIYIIS